jgi:hypothetical protein
MSTVPRSLFVSDGDDCCSGPQAAEVQAGCDFATNFTDEKPALLALALLLDG